MIFSRTFMNFFAVLNGSKPTMSKKLVFGQTNLIKCVLPTNNHFCNNLLITLISWVLLCLLLMTYHGCQDQDNSHFSELILAAQHVVWPQPSTTFRRIRSISCDSLLVWDDRGQGRNPLSRRKWQMISILGVLRFLFGFDRFQKFSHSLRCPSNASILIALCSLVTSRTGGSTLWVTCAVSASK